MARARGSPAVVHAGVVQCHDGERGGAHMGVGDEEAGGRRGGAKWAPHLFSPPPPRSSKPGWRSRGTLWQGVECEKKSKLKKNAKYKMHRNYFVHFMRLR